MATNTPGSAATNQDFVTYKGDSPAPVFTVRDASGVAVNLESVLDIGWFAKRAEEDTPLLTKTKTGGDITFVTNGTDGKFQVSITAGDTGAMDGFYIHYATVTDSFGNVVTVAVGRMQVGIAPQWTYNPGEVGTSNLYTVRSIIGDVKIGDQLLFDAEITWAISQYSNLYLASAECCRNISARFSRDVDSQQGELRTLYSSRAKAYAERAKDLEYRGMSRGAGAMPFVGGISVTDKAAQLSDPDRVTPQFNIGMNENLLPIGVGSGNLTPANPAGGNTENTSSGPVSP